MKLFLPLYETGVGVISLILDYLIQRFNLLTQYQTFFLLIGTVSLIAALLSFFLLIRKRSFKNYLKSLIDTNRLRNFLRQQKVINDFTSKAKVDINLNIYNSALHYTYIDYFPDHVDIWIYIPNNVAAKKILDENLKSAEQEFKLYNTAYIISACKSEKHYYHYHGEKK